MKEGLCHRLRHFTRSWGSVWNRWQNSRFIRLGAYLLFAAVLYVLLMGNVIPEMHEVRIGGLSQETLRSPVQAVDPVATEEAQREAENSVEQQYYRDTTVLEDQIERLDVAFSELRSILDDDMLSYKERVDKLTQLFPWVPLTEEEREGLGALSVEEAENLHSITRSAVIVVLNEGVREGTNEIQSAQQQAVAQIESFQLPEDEKQVAGKIAAASIRSNVLYDPVETRHLKEAARNQVEPVIIEKGEVLVREGERITEEVYQKLELVGLVREPGQNVWHYLALAGLVVLFPFMIQAYLIQSQFLAKQNNQLFLLYLAILLLNVIVLKVFSSVQELGFHGLGYAAPSTLGVMLTILLLDRTLAVFTGFLFSILAAIFFNTEPGDLFDFSYGLIYFVGAMTCVLVLSRTSQRPAILKAGLWTSLMNVGAITLITFLSFGFSTWQDWLLSVLYGCVGGILASILTIGLMPFFESSFGILSAVRLIELSNPHQPLLRRLLTETPGTYHHSMMVGNLAEVACEAVGVNGLLARVGSYYHDVGKMKRPAFFIENQMNNMENPHDKISPYLSKSIILAHPYDGVKMLQEAGIPRAIRDFAEQHHGTTLLKYFYHKAQELSDGSEVLEGDYRYPGPKAQTRETAIVGICDSVEAAVRSMTKTDPARIQTLVRGIIKERLDDGQFDECDLTLKDLDEIATAICETLNGLFHPRIEYPELHREKKVKMRQSV